MANVFSPLKILIVYLNSPEITAILAYFGLNLVVMVIPSDLLKILISYFDFSTPKTYYSRERCHDIMYRNETSAILSYFFPKYGCYGNSLSSLENSDSIFVSADPENATIHAKCLDILHRAKISAILDYFCPHFIAMATALASLKIQIASFNSPTTKTLPYTQKVFRYVVQK